MTNDAIVYFGMGFLFASLIALAIMPLVHSYAVKQTTRSLEAGFAASTESLEIIIEELRSKVATQHAELAHKDGEIDRLKIDCAALDIDVASLKTQFRALEVIEPPKHNNLVPILPKLKSPKTAAENFNDASIVPTMTLGLDEDTWTREKKPSDVSEVSPSGENDTWVRVEAGSDRMARGGALTKNTKTKIR